MHGEIPLGALIRAWSTGAGPDQGTGRYLATLHGTPMEPTKTKLEGKPKGSLKERGYKLGKNIYIYFFKTRFSLNQPTGPIQS